MVTVELPTVAVRGTVRVILTFAGLFDSTFAADEGEKAQVAFTGSPEQVRVTVPLKDPTLVTVKFKLEEIVPRGTVRDAGVGAVSEKSTTWSDNGTLCVV
jgi:hypothetical protein